MISDPGLRRVVRQVAPLLPLRGLSAVAALGCQLVLLSALGVVEYGLQVIVLSWVQFFAVAAKQGRESIAVRRGALLLSRDGPKGFRRQVGVLLLLTLRGWLVGSLLALAVVAGNAPQHTELVASASACVGLQAVLGVQQANLRAQSRAALALFSSSAVRPLTVLALLAIQPGRYESALDGLWLHAIGLACGVGVASIALGMPFSGRSWAKWKWRDPWFREGLGYCWSSLVLLLLARLDVVVLGWLDGSRAVGLYAPGTRIAELSTYGVLSLQLVIGPRIATMHGDGNLRELRGLLRFARLLCLASALVLSVLALWMVGWLELIFELGPFSRTVLLVLLAGNTVSAGFGMAAVALAMVGEARSLAVTTTQVAALNFFLLVVLVPHLGPVGAAIAKAASGVALMLAADLRLRRFLDRESARQFSTDSPV